MKNLVSLLAIMTAFSIASLGQIRHVPGVRSVEVFYGVSGHGAVQGASFISYWKPNLYMKVNAFFEAGQESGVSYQSYGADFKMARTVLKKSPVFYVNLTGGATIALDKPVSGAELFNVNQTFKYGALAGVELELFLSDKFVFVTSFDQRFLIGSEFGNYRWYATGGIRFNF
jgi:hypothetical protein